MHIPLRSLIVRCLIALILTQAGGRLLAGDILLVTDVHFNPFDHEPGQPGPDIAKFGPDISAWRFPPCPRVTYGQETNEGSLEPSLKEIHRLAAIHKIHDVFICGDMLEHHFDTEFRQYGGSPQDLAEFSSNVILYVLNQIRTATGNAHIFFTLGNNDTDVSHYGLPTKAFMTNLSNGLFGERETAAKATFARLGYAATPLNASVEVIALNGNLLAWSHEVSDLADEQFALLRRDLETCRLQNRHAIILIHEPFGIHPRRSFKKKRPVPILNQDIQREYLTLLSKYASTVSAIYAGHFHREYFQSVGGKIPVVGTLALNPLSNNNPGFKILVVDAQNGRLLDYTTWIDNLASRSPKWKPLYQFRQTYNPHSLPFVDAVNAIPEDINSREVRSYRSLYAGKTPFMQPIDNDAAWPWFFAAISHLDTDSYARFMERKFPSTVAGH